MRNRYFAQLGPRRATVYANDVTDALVQFTRPYLMGMQLPERPQLIRIIRVGTDVVLEVPLSQVLVTSPCGAVTRNSQTPVSQAGAALERPFAKLPSKLSRRIAKDDAFMAGGYYLRPDAAQERHNNQQLYARLQEVRRANGNGLVDRPYRFGV